LKHKSQAYETFRNFHVWVKHEAQPSIRTLCTDNGEEYTCSKFETYLCQHGIKHQTIIPYNPQQNGVVERMNVVRSMLFFKNVKLMFWDDVVLCTMYVRNKSPFFSLGNKTPY
jgi:transposase InsO family protein